MAAAERPDLREGDEGSGDWQAGWVEHRRRQLESFASATPARRLAWLEEMLELARRSGALPRPRDPWGR